MTSNNSFLEKRDIIALRFRMDSPFDIGVPGGRNLRRPGGVKIIGEVVNMSADDSTLSSDGLVDADKARFLSFDRVRRVYRVLGGVVGTAYHDGTKLMRKN